MKKTIFVISAMAMGLMSMSASASVIEKVNPNQDKMIVSNVAGFAVPVDNVKNIKYTDLQSLNSKEEFNAYMKKISANENAKLIFYGSAANVNSKPSVLSMSRDVPYWKSVSHSLSADEESTMLRKSVFQDGISMVLNQKEDHGFIRTKMDFVNNSLLSIKKGNTQEGKPDLLDVHTTKIESSFITKPNQVIKFDTPVYQRDGKEYKDVYFVQQTM